MAITGKWHGCHFKKVKKEKKSDQQGKKHLDQLWIMLVLVTAPESWSKYTKVERHCVRLRRAFNDRDVKK